MNTLRRFWSSRAAQFASVLLVLVLLIAAFAPWLAPQDPYDLAQLDVMEGRLPPGAASLDHYRHYWLGTDEQGRDMLSAIFYGLRSSLYVGVMATLCALALGSTLGVAAGYFGGWLESLVMRIVDIQLSFPAILIALILIAALGQGVEKVIIALIAVQWAYYARTARAAAVVERRKEYIEAAVCQGLSATRILFRHLLPNCLPPLMVVANRRGDYARSDALLPRTGPADHGALARFADRQGLQLSALRPLLDQRFPRPGAAAHHHQHQSRRRSTARHARPAQRTLIRSSTIVRRHDRASEPV